jgi:hypothetical protein
METQNTEKNTSNEVIAKFKKQTPITILIQDLLESCVLSEDDYQKNIILKIVDVLKESYTNRERDIITKFAFDFYADLSRERNVPENLISENLTLAEAYFDEKFN